MIGGVVAFIALFLLSGGVANVVGSGQAHTEKTAVSTLRTLHWAQDRFRSGGFADADGDGVAEFGTLEQLAGRAPLPDGTMIPASLLQYPGSEIQGDLLMAHGFCFRLELPEDVEGRERRFVAWSWPRTSAAGHKAFCINHDEDILESTNEAGYVGCDAGPPVGSCPSAAEVDAGAPGWKRWRGKTSQRPIGARE